MGSRPLQTLEFNANGELDFFTAADSHKIAELRVNLDVNIVDAHPGERCYVSVRGTARIDRDRMTIDELWSATQRVFFAQGKDVPNLAVRRAHVRDAAYWEWAGNFVVRALDFARGMLTEGPSDLGRQGRLSGSY